MSNKYLVVIAGPTAIGKTKLSIDLAKEFHSSILSADSRQIYREMTIGTAVPSADELNTVKHYFIQAKSVKEKYNASMYESEAISLLDELHKKNNVVFLTGGSGLYIDAVCKGIDEFPDTNPELRIELYNKLRNEGIESLRKELKTLDPESFSKIDLNNPKRIQKALEISLMTGKPYSSFLTGIIKKRPFNIILISLDITREKLYARINQRTLRMIDEGLVEEAERLFPLKHYNSLNTVGYTELFEHFEGRQSLQEAIVKIQTNTRKYARKQLTWFRKNKKYKWFTPENTEGIKSFIENKIKEDNE